MTHFDPERTFLEMQQKCQFLIYSLMKNNSPKDHRLGKTDRLHLPEKVPARSFSHRTRRLVPVSYIGRQHD